MRDFAGIDFLVDGFLKEAQAVKPKPPPELLARYKANPKDSATRAEYQNWTRSAANQMADTAQTQARARMQNAGIPQAEDAPKFWSGRMWKGMGQRAKQVASHDFTDTFSGLAHGIGAHGLGSRIDRWQRELDENAYSKMSPEMRDEYLENKSGRIAAAISSYAANAAMMEGAFGLAGKAAPLLRRIPGLSKAKSLVNAAGSHVANVASAPGRWATRAVNFGKSQLAKRAPKLTSAGSRVLFQARRVVAPVADAARTAKTYASAVAKPTTRATGRIARDTVPALRGKAIENRYAVDGSNNIINAATGDDNYLTRFEDRLNELWSRGRARLGSERDMEANLGRMDMYDQLHNSDAFSKYDPTILTLDGRPVMEFVGYDKYGRPVSTPVKVRNKLMAERLRKEMSDRNAFAASRSHGPLATSLVGRLRGESQPVYTKTPGIDWGESARFPSVVPRPVVDNNGNYMLRDPYHSWLGRNIARVVSYTPTLLPYTLTSNMIDAGYQGDYGRAAGNLAGLAVGPVVGNAVGSSGIPYAKGLSVPASLAGYTVPGWLSGKAQRLVFPYSDAYIASRKDSLRRKLIDELINKERGNILPGYWTFLGDKQ